MQTPESARDYLRNVLPAARMQPYSVVNRVEVVAYAVEPCGPDHQIVALLAPILRHTYYLPSTLRADGFTGAQVREAEKLVHNFDAWSNETSASAIVTLVAYAELCHDLHPIAQMELRKRGPRAYHDAQQVQMMMQARHIESLLDSGIASIIPARTDEILTKRFTAVR